MSEPKSRGLDDDNISRIPPVLAAIQSNTDEIRFQLASERKTGSLLRALAASKPGGRFLELGTGTGVGTAWLLAGMDRRSRLVSVDTDPAVQNVAKRNLSEDTRVTFQLEDGATFLEHATERFDLIYADAWPGKFTHLDRALSLLNPGGIYFIDDLLPQPNWPEGHAPRVPALIEDLEGRRGFVATKMAWATGLMMVVRTDEQSQNQ